MHKPIVFVYLLSMICYYEYIFIKNDNLKQNKKRFYIKKNNDN